MTKSKYPSAWKCSRQSLILSKESSISTQSPKTRYPFPSLPNSCTIFKSSPVSSPKLNCTNCSRSATMKALTRSLKTNHSGLLICSSRKNTTQAARKVSPASIPASITRKTIKEETRILERKNSCISALSLC